MNLLDLQPGYIIDGHYSLEKMLGEGASGKVFLARDLDLNRSVAIKVLNLNASIGGGSDALARFDREAKALSRLLHSNIVRVFRFGKLENDTPYLVMEYVEGESLHSLLERKKLLNCQEAIEIALQVCVALEYAHSMGLVHRDLKPENIVLSSTGEPPTVKLLDFGLCKESAGQSAQESLTKTGFLVGTALYMSPEQCLGRQVDYRSDIYSFGCVLFEMITGEPAFKSDSISNTLIMHLNEPIPAILSLSEDCGLPPLLEELIVKCGAIDKEQRYQSFTLVRGVLEEIRLMNCRAYFDPEQAKRQKGKNKILKPITALTKRVVFIAAIALLVFLLAAAAILFSGDEGSLRIAKLRQQIQSPTDAAASLKAMLKSSLSSGKTKLANELVQETTCSDAFRHWSSLDRQNLISNYIRVYQDSSMAKEVLALKLDLMEQLMASIKRKKRANKAADPTEQEALNKLAQELLDQKHSKSEWTQISISMEKYNDTKRGNPYGLYPAVLRCEGLRLRDGLFDDGKAREALKHYRSVIDEASKADNSELVSKLFPEFLAIEHKFGLTSEEIYLHACFARDALRHAEVAKARKELGIVDALSVDNAASQPDQLFIKRVHLACQKGTNMEAIEPIADQRSSITDALIFGAKKK